MDNEMKKIVENFCGDISSRYILLYDAGNGARHGFPMVTCVNDSDESAQKLDENFITVFFDRQAAAEYVARYCTDNESRTRFALIPDAHSFAEILFGCAVNGISGVAVITSASDGNVEGVNCDVMFMLQILGRRDDCVFSMAMLEPMIPALTFAESTC